MDSKWSDGGRNPSPHSFRRRSDIDNHDGQPSPLGPGEILVRVLAAA